MARYEATVVKLGRVHGHVPDIVMRVGRTHGHMMGHMPFARQPWPASENPESTATCQARL